MKYAILLAAIVFATSCRKHRCNPIVPVTPTLVGTWSSGEPTNLVHTFTKDSLSWDGAAMQKYTASTDSIRLSTFAMRYELSKSNDSLTLYRAGITGKPVGIRYHRIH